MLLDDAVDFVHQPDGLLQDEHDLIVVGDVSAREAPPLPVLQPPLTDLVAAKLETHTSAGTPRSTDPPAAHEVGRG